MFEDKSQVINQLEGLSDEKLKTIKRLELEGLNLKTVPFILAKCINLQYLDLSRNQIEILPDFITKLKKLTFLNLQKNKIKLLPKSLQVFSNLQYLDLRDNELEKFPFELLELLNLTEIHLINNPYLDFPLLNELKAAVNNLAVDNELQLVQLLKKWHNKSVTPENYNYFTLKIPKILQTPMLQYIEFFKDYVEATKGKEIIFDIKRDEAGLILITNGNTGVTLPELGEYFQEYVNFVQQDLEKWIPNFDIPKTPLEADIFRSKMERQVNNLRSDLEMARIESNYLRDKVKDSETQIDFLKDLTKDLRHDIRLLIEGRTPETLNVDQLLLDIIDQAIRMLERRYSHGLEDLHNDILTEFLRQKGYNATDQTRSGRSKLGVGEIDIMIRKKNGTPFSIIEAFRLSSCGEDNKTVAAHLDKLVHDYDTAGHERNFIIVYAEAKNFEKLWENYQIYMNELNGKSTFRATYPLISFKEKADVSEKSSIKIGIAKHRREGAIVEIYHVFINMFGAKVG